MERALKHTFEPKKRVWAKEIIEVSIEDQPFAEGSFRRAHMGKINVNRQTVAFVCKFAIEKSTTKSLYFNDVEAQVFAKIWAQKFNSLNPPKPIDFVDCFVLEFVDRPGRPLAGCELYLAGKFTKKNNNVGAVVAPSKFDSKIDLDIAQAFSHFSFEKSNQSLLICDIQGVENAYTDPQIHTNNGEGFGGGNLGMTGIRAFLLRHVCNDVCRQMGLQAIKAEALPDEKTASTENPKATSSRMANSNAALCAPSVSVNGSPSTPRQSSALPDFDAWDASASASPAPAPAASSSSPSLSVSTARKERDQRESQQDRFRSLLDADAPSSPTAASMKKDESALQALEADMMGHLDGLELDS